MYIYYPSRWADDHFPAKNNHLGQQNAVNLGSDTAKTGLIDSRADNVNNLMS